MALDEVTDVIKKASIAGMDVARIHSGDPSLYGAIQEQMSWCEKNNTLYKVIPGVSSFSAAAAALKQELTLPGISQTVVITRFPGRTKVPEGKTTVIFLSIQDISNVVKRLLCDYSDNTPVAVVSKASWPDEKIIIGALNDIAAKVKKSGIKRQALIFVGNVLKKRDFQKSRLYGKNFPHMYRK
jgi:precorrin-4/cobalt-precorrin-4 C11-methyltransferase